MLPLGLFKRPAFTGVQLAAFGISASMFALFLYLTLYLQNFLGHSPTEAGLRYLPLTVAVFLVAPIAGALLSKVQARVLISLGLVGAGAGLMLMAGVDATDDWTGLLGGFIVAGAGVGLLNPAIADVAVSVVPKEQSGMASGINDTFRQVGVALGVAVWGAIFLGAGTSKVQELTGLGADRSREIVEAASSGNLDQALTQVPAGSRAQVADAAREGFLAGFNSISVLGGILAFAAAIGAFLLVRERDIERGAVEAVEVEADAVRGRPERSRRAQAVPAADRAPELQDAMRTGAPAAVCTRAPARAGAHRRSHELGVAGNASAEQVAEVVAEHWPGSLAGERLRGPIRWQESKRPDRKRGQCRTSLRSAPSSSHRRSCGRS